jgi:hypothetical protein
MLNGSKALLVYRNKQPLGEPTIWPPVRTMTSIWIARIALPFFVLTAASGAALVSGILYETRPPAETRAATTAAAVPPTADVGDEGSAAFAKVLPPAVSPGLPDIGDAITPAFDFALVGRAGDAVIAGTAAPAAAVDRCAMARSLIERLQINLGTSS